MLNLSYCANQVYERDRDHFLASLFVPEAFREPLWALLALNLELSEVRGKVSEPVIGQMRLAWWQEAIAEVYAGMPRRGQPVLQALMLITPHLPQEALIQLTASYREHFPAAPPEEGLEALIASLLQSLCPQALPGWRKAREVTAGHRRRYGRKRNGWLHLKLLLAGF